MAMAPEQHGASRSRPLLSSCVGMADWEAVYGPDGGVVNSPLRPIAPEHAHDTTAHKRSDQQTLWAG